MRWWLLLSCVLCLTACNVVITSTAEAPAPTAAPAPAAAPPLAGGAAEVPGAARTELVLKGLVAYLAFFAELCGALVIGVATIREFVRYVPHVFRAPRASEDYQEDIRLRLGRSLALALEFELGADILRTAVAPSFSAIAVTAAVIVLRTLLNYFLERELRQVEERRGTTAERR